MLSSVLNSEKAIQVKVTIIPIFVPLRQVALNYSGLAEKIKKLEKNYNKNSREIFKVLGCLVADKHWQENFENRIRIGFKS